MFRESSNVDRASGLGRSVRQGLMSILHCVRGTSSLSTREVRSVVQSTHSRMGDYRRTKAKHMGAAVRGRWDHWEYQVNP